MFVKIDNSNNLVRDTDSMLISNTNQAERDAYYNRKSILRQQKESINNLKKEIDTLKTDMSDIKNLLTQLVNSR